MTRFRSIKNSFLGGQISPTAQGRTDQPTYVHSCAKLQNMLPLPSGGAYRRPGTLNVDSLPITTNYAPRLIPFVPTLNNAAGGGVPYCLLLGKTVGGATYAQVYIATSNSNDSFGPSAVHTTGSWLSGPQYIFKTPSNYNVPNSNNVDAQDDEIHQIQWAQSGNILFLVHPNHPPQLLTQTGFGNFTWAQFDSQSQYTFNASQTDVNGLAWASQYPFLDMNSNKSITLSAGTGYATVGASINITCNTSGFFQSTGGINNTGHVGSIFKINSAGTAAPPVASLTPESGGGIAIITSVTSSTVAVATVLVPFAGTEAIFQWWESAWSNFRGWPKSICFYLQRLIAAGTYNQPDTIFCSAAAGFNIFSTPNTTFPSANQGSGDGSTTGPIGSQAFGIPLNQTQTDAIQWLSPDKQLLVGTTGQEWLLFGSTVGTDIAFDASTAQAQIQSHYGSDSVSAVRIGYELIFQTRSKTEMKAYQYNYFDQSFFAESIQLGFDEYPIAEASGYLGGGRRKVRWMDWDSTRSVFWVLDTSGNFYGLTRDRKLQLTAWHTHQFGGYNPAQGKAFIGTGSSQTIDPSYYVCDGSVLSVAIIPNPQMGVQDIWLVVKRTLNGVVNFQVERMIGANTVKTTVLNSVFPGGFNEPFLLDSCSIAGDSSSGLPTYEYYATTNSNSFGQYAGTNKNLEGYTPVANYYSPTYGIFQLPCNQVVNGIVSISGPPADYGTTTNPVVIGLPFTPILQPVRIEAGSQMGTAQGAIKAFGRVIVRLYRTMSLTVGQPPTSEDTVAPEEVDFSYYNQPMGNSVELFTGDKIVFPPNTYETDGYIYLSQDVSLPLTVVAIIYEGVEFDES